MPCTFFQNSPRKNIFYFFAILVTGVVPLDVYRAGHIFCVWVSRLRGGYGGVSHKSPVAHSRYISGFGPWFRHSQPVLKKLVSLKPVTVASRLALHWLQCRADRAPSGSYLAWCGSCRVWLGFQTLSINVLYHALENTLKKKTCDLLILRGRCIFWFFGP